MSLGYDCRSDQPTLRGVKSAGSREQVAGRCGRNGGRDLFSWT